MADVASLRPLLERCKQQDHAAFADLFAQFHLRVARSAYLITRRPDLVDDITQHVFLELFSAFRRYDLSRPFVPWLYRVVYNICMDHLKRVYRDNRYTASMDATYEQIVLYPDPTPGPAEQAERMELRHTVLEAITRLPVKQRSVLVLRYYDGLSEAEIAEVLECRLGTVKSRLHYAHQALGEVLSGAHVPLPFDLPEDEYGQMRKYGPRRASVAVQEGGE
jgi:RNA polymerase sigma-70 factor (ECF subfamily)